MIPLIAQAGWLYQVHRNRQYWLTKAEKRRALVLVCAISASIALSTLLWVAYR